MKLLLVSEGKHELSGALETLVRSLSQYELAIDHAKVSQGKTHAHHGKGRGYFKRAVRWLLEARKRGYDAMVLVIDEDSYSERAKEIAEAQQYAAVDFRRAFGVAIRTFDAWMLADEHTLTSVLGRPVDRQPEPEKLKDPKGVCAELRDASKGNLAQSEMYAQIAEFIEFPVLEERCPRGFAPFAAHVRRL